MTKETPKVTLKEMFEEDPDIKEVLRVLEPKPLNEYLDPNNPTEAELRIRQEIIEYNEKQHANAFCLINIKEIGNCISFIFVQP